MPSVVQKGTLRLSKEEGDYSDVLNPSPQSHHTKPSPDLAWEVGLGGGSLGDRVGVLSSNPTAQTCSRMGWVLGRGSHISIPSKTFIFYWEVCEPRGEVWSARLGRLAPLVVAQHERGSEGLFTHLRNG